MKRPLAVFISFNLIVLSVALFLILSNVDMSQLIDLISSLKGD